MQWYYADGPHQVLFDESALGQLIASRQITPATPLWNETMEDWVGAGELFPDHFANMPPVPPAPPPRPGQAQAGQPPPKEGFSALDAIVPTNPLAAFSCYIGIFSCIICGSGIILGPLAIVLGILARKKWKVQESAYGETASSIRIWIGIISGVIGILISLGAIGMALADM